MIIKVMDNKITSSCIIRDVKLMINNKEVEVLYWTTEKDGGTFFDGFEILDDEPTKFSIAEKQAMLRMLRSEEINGKERDAN